MAEAALIQTWRDVRRPGPDEEPPELLPNARRNSDETLRKLERAVQEDLSPTNVILLARAYERGGEAPELWLVTDMIEDWSSPRSLWSTEAEAKREAARLYFESLDGRDDDPLRSYTYEDAEYEDEEDAPPPVMRQEVLDAWATGDIDRVLARAKDYIRRAVRKKWQWSYDVHGPLRIGRDRGTGGEHL